MRGIDVIVEEAGSNREIAVVRVTGYVDTTTSHELEKKIKDDLSVTVRCIPLEKSEAGTCPFTGKPSAQRVVWAKAY